MQISTFTDYSIRVLIYLATLPKEELTQISHVSRLYNISRNHLVKVIHKLSQLGYIETIQGKNGGFRLNMSPENIHIGDVFRHLEPLQLLNCDLAFCHISPACRLKGYLIDAKEAFLQELDQYTIQDLLTNNTEIVDLLEHSN